MAEIQIGEAAEAWTTAEIVAAFRRLLELAAEPARPPEGSPPEAEN
jgi:hypothetical protein